MTGPLVAYLRQRFPLWVFVPVLGMLTGLVSWTTASPVISVASGRAALLIIGIVVFLRIWDDIEDRGIDRVAHPDRVLPQAPVGRFVWLQVAIASGLAGLLLWSGSGAAGMGFVGLVVAAGGAYRVVRPHISPAVWPYLLLMKYPAVVATVAQAAGQPRPGRLLAAILLTYVGACAYEDLHTRRRRPHSPGVTA